MRLLARLRARHIEAERSAAAAADHLREVEARTPKVRALARSLIEIQQTNHLGASAAKILRGDR